MFTRNEKGQFTKSDATKTEEEVKIEKKPESYGFYSKILSKPFDTLEELQKAEEDYRKEQEEKEAKIVAKKNDASKVEEAFKTLNAAKRTSNEKIREAKAEFQKIYSEAKSKYTEIVNAANAEIEDAEADYSAALREFTDKHPEGYHVTLKDGDNVTTISRSASFDLLKDFDELFNFIFRF